jgi:hypothetical protein
MMAGHDACKAYMSRRLHCSSPLGRAMPTLADQRRGATIVYQGP